MASDGFPPTIAFEVAIILILLMVAVTLMGRQLARLLPYRLRPRAILYLSPALGLGLLVLAASHVGRLIGFATLPTAVAAVMASGAMLAWMCERRRAEAALHAAIVAALSIVAGSAILMCVWRFGGFDSANDAFTYLAHGNWLQTHAFSDTIRPDDIEPYSSQVALYQQADFRMGGSYLLGWIQAMAGLRWSYVAYPVTVAAAAGAFSLATVFAASLFARVRPLHGYLLACLPGTGAGGVVFAMIKGFLPQLLGGAVALACLALAGALLVEFTRPAGSLPRTAHWRAGLALGGLFAVVVTAYSEQSPLVALGLLMAGGIILAVAPQNRLQLVKLIGASVVAAVALMNIEALRAARAIVEQANALVGWPVDWSVIEYLGHAVGIHGGSGDVVEWIGGRPAFDIAFMIGLAALALWTWRHPRRADITAALPLLCFAALCIAGFVYFRYMVPAPFPLGKGQSWSEFKLAGWASPVAAVLIAAMLARLMTSSRSHLITAILVLVLAQGLLRNYVVAADRMMPITDQLGADRPIFETLLSIRANVMQHLRPGEVVYLDMSGEFVKLRQLLSYMLYDVHVTADWLDDAYISPHLPPGDRNPSRKSAAYVIVPVTLVPAGVRQRLIWRAGNLAMVARQDGQYAEISSVKGGYDRETDGPRWWFWVKDEIVFTLSEIDIGEAVLRRRISFEYWPTGKNNLSLEIIGTKDRLKLALPSPPEGKGMFDQTLAASLGRVQKVIVRGDDEPVRLGPNDPRTAKFLIANLEIEAIPADPSAR